ncbi:MAG: TetR/AcrR family transcriptional regulator [Spirochaetes bacterium]|jgi:AcrR family transcriptional regulator|nr:TetR/AcrR family transcriptional regulator [Spirochaetota bacterium]
MSEKKSTHIRQEEIVQAALKVIGQKGVGALTIATIAEAADMTESNIYRHFGGKQDIYFALAKFIGNAVMGKAAAIAAGSRKPWEKLETIFFSHITLVLKNPGIPRFIFSEDIRLGNKKLAEKISLRLNNYIDTLAGIIEAGIAEGDFRQGISPRESAKTLLGIIQSTSLSWAMDGKSFNIKTEAEKIWRNYLTLMR